MQHQKMHEIKFKPENTSESILFCTQNLIKTHCISIVNIKAQCN